MQRQLVQTDRGRSNLRMSGDEAEMDHTDEEREEETDIVSQAQSQAACGSKGKTKAAKQPEYPCLACGENCRKNQHAVKCMLCALWAHKTCVKMSDGTFQALNLQMRESGSAPWACRPCQNFAQRVTNQLVWITSILIISTKISFPKKL